MPFWPYGRERTTRHHEGCSDLAVVPLFHPELALCHDNSQYNPLCQSPEGRKIPVLGFVAHIFERQYTSVFL
jgi:hypothetical protein